MTAPCRFLRSKTMYIPQVGEVEAIAPTKDATADAACHYWCNRTLTEVGFDDQPVHRDVCRPGRACFEE
jgi:hypothetical protein